MGVDSGSVYALLDVFGEGAVHQESLPEDHPCHPNTQLRIVDAQSWLEYVPGDVKTGGDFLRFFANRVRARFRTGCGFLVLCFDERAFIPAPLLRTQRAKLSRRPVKALGTPGDICNAPFFSENCEMPADWGSLLRNPRLVQELKFFVTSHLLGCDPRELGVPEGGWLAIQAGLAERPTSPEYRPPRECHVHFIYRGAEGGGKWERKKAMTNRIGQAEMACLYFCRGCSQVSVEVESESYSVLPAAMMLSRDRCNPGEPNFHNHLVLRLKRRQHSDLLVDCNHLYENLSSHPMFSGYLCREVAFSGAVALCGTDSFADYASGIGASTILSCLFEQPKDSSFGFLFGMRFPRDLRASSGGDMRTRRYLYVDEREFERFTQQLYLEKHGKAAKVEKGDTRRRALEKVIKHLERGKSAKRRYPSQEKISASCRRLLWTLSYWCNSYRDMYDGVEGVVVSYMNQDLLYCSKISGASVYGYEDSGRQTDKVEPLSSFVMMVNEGSYEYPFAHGYSKKQMLSSKRKHAHGDVRREGGKMARFSD